MLMSDTARRRPNRAPELVLTVQYGVRPDRLPSRTQLRLWARTALRRDARITLRIAGTREARRLNRDFRAKDYPTNVLTFVYRKRPALEGDIVLCAPVVAREARQRRLDADAHYAHLVVHSVLHLQGHDHLRVRETQRMERLETRILADLGYADPYQA